MDLNFVLCVLAICVSLTEAQSFRYRYRGRRTRPASRLFGSSYQTSRSRYDPGSRPASRPFTVPGFGNAFGSSSRSSSSLNTYRNNLGFNLGFTGRAFADPIAGIYDPTNSVVDGRVLGQTSSTGFNDRVNEFASLNPAANTRSSLSRESKTALDPALFNSRRRQDLGTHDMYVTSRGLGLGDMGLRFTNQDNNQFVTTGSAGGFAAQDLTSVVKQPMDISNYRSQLGAAISNKNQLGANQLNGLFIDATALGDGGLTGLDFANLGASSSGIQASINGLDMQGTQGIVDTTNLLTGHEHQIVSGQHQGLANQLGINTHQLGLGSNQLGLGAAKQLDLGQNKLVLDTNSLGLDGNHVIIQSEQMEMPNLAQSGMSSENQLILGPSAGQMDILGNQLGLANGQQLITSNQINSGLGQLSAGNLDGESALQGQTIAMSPKSSSEGSQFITVSGDFPSAALTRQAMTSQGALGASSHFYTPKEEVQIVGQSQNAGQMTSQLNNALLTELSQGA